MGVTAAMACASLVAAPIMAQAQSNAQVSAKKDVQVIAFQQTWNTIAKECTETYGPEAWATSKYRRRRNPSKAPNGGRATSR